MPSVRNVERNGFLTKKAKVPGGSKNLPWIRGDWTDFIPLVVVITDMALILLIYLVVALPPSTIHVFSTLFPALLF